jgi:putative sporulation protein YtxC
LLEIHFQRLEDATPLFLQFKKFLSISQSDNYILLDEDQHIVRINTNHLSEEVFLLIKKLLCDFILETKCDDWFRRIITEKFFFQDQEEVQHIVDIVHSILEGERKELAVFFKEFEHRNDLYQIVNQVIKRELSFSFDSFVKFRLRPFMEKLEKYVQVSIDEYKMEQDYQMFIQTLRDFISTRAPKLTHLHIVMGEEVTFYNDQLSAISRSEILKMIDRKLLFNHPVYVDSTTIAPLLSIAPSTFCLYTKDVEQPLVRTIKNIFEERVQIQTMESFLQRKNDNPPMQYENK